MSATETLSCDATVTEPSSPGGPATDAGNGGASKKGKAPKAPKGPKQTIAKKRPSKKDIKYQGLNAYPAPLVMLNLEIQGMELQLTKLKELEETRGAARTLEKPISHTEDKIAKAKERLVKATEEWQAKQASSKLNRGISAKNALKVKKAKQEKRLADEAIGGAAQDLMAQLQAKIAAGETDLSDFAGVLQALIPVEAAEEAAEEEEEEAAEEEEEAAPEAMETEEESDDEEEEDKEEEEEEEDKEEEDSDDEEEEK